MRREFAAVFIKEHCFAKNALKSSAFSLKSVTNLFPGNKGGFRGIFFYCLKNGLKETNMS